MKKKHRKIPSTVYLIFVMIIMYIPILVTIFYSFNESKLSSVWGGFSLKWYQTLFADHDIWEALGNTLILAAVSCALSIVIGTLGAYGMSKLKGKRIEKFNSTITYLSRLPIMIPEIILGMVFLAVFSFMGLPFGMLTLIIAHTSFCIPYIIIQVHSRLIGIDKSLEEAAKDLGASPLRAFFDITLPNLLPAIASGTIIAFAMSIDDVVISIFTTGPTVNLLPIKIYTRVKTGVTPEINALAALMFLFTIIMVVIADTIARKGEKRR